MEKGLSAVVFGGTGAVGSVWYSGDVEFCVIANGLQTMVTSALRSSEATGRMGGAAEQGKVVSAGRGGYGQIVQGGGVEAEWVR